MTNGEWLATLDSAEMAKIINANIKSYICRRMEECCEICEDCVEKWLKKDYAEFKEEKCKLRKAEELTEPLEQRIKVLERVLCNEVRNALQTYRNEFVRGENVAEQEIAEWLNKAIENAENELEKED